MTTATLENIGTNPDTNATGWSWSYESCKLWLDSHRWTLNAMEYLIENVLVDDDEDTDDGVLTAEILSEVAPDFWANTPGIRPGVERLVSMAKENTFDDDCVFYEQGDEWLSNTSKKFQTAFLWKFWQYSSPCELNSGVVTLMGSEDLYVSSLATVVRAYEQISSGHLETEGGTGCLEAAYKALTNKEFIIRLKQARMLSSDFVGAVRVIELEITGNRHFTDEQKNKLSRFLRSQDI